MTVTWVVGAGGLLGRAIVARAEAEGRQLFRPGAAFQWNDAGRLSLQMKAAAREFALASQDQAHWEICWACGVGTMNSNDAALAPEMLALDTLLASLAELEAFATRPGTIVLASSAGALYAGSRAEVNTERTPTQPTTPYGRAKLAQEARLATWRAQMAHVSIGVARITTLYGPGQAAHKAQGLLTNIARRALRNQVIHVYVPLDTIRDYIYVADAAEEILGLLIMLERTPGTLTKIVASEEATTIAKIIAEFKKALSRPPRLVTGSTSAAAAYSKQILFKSELPRRPGARPRTSLCVGVAALLQDERMRMAKGQS